MATATRKPKLVSSLRKGDIITIDDTEYTVIKKGKGYGDGETRIVYNEFPENENFEKSATYQAGVRVNEM